MINLEKIKLEQEIKNLKAEITPEEFFELALELFLDCNGDLISTCSIFSQKNRRYAILQEICGSSEINDEILIKNGIDNENLDGIYERVYYEMIRSINDYVSSRIFEFSRHAIILGFKLNFDLHDHIEEFQKRIFNKFSFREKDQD